MSSLFSGAVDSQRHLVGLIWSFVMMIAAISIVIAFVYSHQVQSGYASKAMLGGYYDGYNDVDDAYYENNNNGDDDDGNNNSHDSQDGDMYYYYYLLSSVKSTPLLGSAIYSSALVGLVSIYGSMFVTGFVGPTLKYVKPCLGSSGRGSGGSKASLHYGMFLGMLFVFANLSFVCALIFSNVWVLDYIEGREKENMPPYAVETFARMFCYLFLTFSFIYSAFGLIVLSFRDTILEGLSADEAACDDEKTDSGPHFITRKETPSY